ADKAQRPEAFQNRNISTATFSGHNLRDHGQADGKLHPHAKPQQHPKRHQLLDVLGQATGQAAYAPKNHAPLKDGFASVLVCQHARNGSSQKHA
uniref:GCM domain-containing protein n=1 Tax=Steinernema glaseri TaxID=37863 RepID=A0A1I7Y4A6_9BILA